MPDKPYNVADRFKDVARRAGEQDVVTGRRKRPNPAAAPPPREKTDDEIAYETRPGASIPQRARGDRHLPYEGPALAALKRR